MSRKHGRHGWDREDNWRERRDGDRHHRRDRDSGGDERHGRERDDD